MKKKNKKFFRLPVYFTILAFISSCSNEPDNFTTETVDGITVIHNTMPKWGEEPQVELEFVRSYGSEDAEDENLQFFQARDAIKDTEGNTYIVDAGNHRIQKFDSDGNYERTIGQEGSGPGELRQPASIVIDDQGVLHVINFQNLRIEKYSTEGEALGSYKLSKIFTAFRLLGDGKILAPVMNVNFPGAPGADDSVKTLVSILDNEGEIIKSFGNLKEYEDQTMTGYANMVFVDTDKQKNIFAVYGMENKIEKYSMDGTLQLRFDRPVPYKIEHKMSTRKVTANGREFEFPFPDLTSVTAGMSIDGKGRLWVSTFFEQPVLPEDLMQFQNATYPEVIHLEVYDTDGVWLGKVNPPEELTMIRIQGDAMLFYNKTLTSIHEFKIVEK